ncbi:MAG: hypothetical protein Q4G16_12025 [Cruoricaptor ignavus]|nr:hypothetical protein [Cruoricaptor ignavus]
MKKLFFASAMLTFAFASAQNVGINTATPKATLDVVGKPADANQLDGIIAPRITGEQLRAKTYTNDQSGALVYVTVADPNPAGQTIDVTATGYYYFDGSATVNKWIRVITPTGNPVDWHVDGNNGTVAANNFVGTRDNVALMFRVNMVRSGFISQFTDNTATPGGANVSLGYEAMPLAPTIPSVSSTGAFRQNVALGWKALGTTNVTGAIVQNVAIGDRTLAALQTGGTNIAIGNKAMQNATTGNSNIAIGVNALMSVSDTNNWGNVALGYRVAENMTAGRNNFFLKNYTATNAGDNFVSGNGNIFIGQDAGNGVINGSNNIAIGAASNLQDKSTQLNIGNLIFGTGINATASATKKVGVATNNTTPATETFHVNGTTRITDLPTNGTANAIYNGADTKTTTFTATRTVVADANGVLGTVAGLPSGGSSWSIESFSVNTTSAHQTIDLSTRTELKDLYVINEVHTANSGYSITVNLPANTQSTTSSRVIRFIGLPTTNNVLGGLSFSGNIGNRDVSNNTGVNITSGTSGSVSFGANSKSRAETVITFVEYNGKWYLDKNNI